MAIIEYRKKRTRQPQEAVGVNPELATLLIPAAGGTFREASGPAWTYNNSGNLSSGISSFGRAVVNASTGYLSRTNPYTSGAVTVGLIFTPSTVTGDEGIWSLAGTAASGGPFLLLQRNGANLRILFGGAYGVTVSGCFSVGKQVSVVVAFSTVEAGISNTVSVGLNGAFFTATAANNFVVKNY